MNGSGFTLRPRPPLDSAEGFFPAVVEMDPARVAQIALSPIFILSLPIPAASAGTLFINGLAQSARTYVHESVSISIPASLNVLAGDVLTYVYPT